MRRQKVIFTAVFLSCFAASLAALPLAAPTLTAPPANATHVPMDADNGLVLAWQPVAAADSYQVQMAGDMIAMPPFMMGAIKDSITTVPFKRMTGLSRGTKYWWRVRSIQGAATSAWSDTLGFTTEPLQSLVLLAPANGAAAEAFKPAGITFTWVDNNPPLPPIFIMPGVPMQGVGYTYQLQVSTDPAFPPALPMPWPMAPMPPYVFNSTIPPATPIPLPPTPPGMPQSYTVATGFTYGKTYYWRMLVSGGTSASEWSPISSFTTALPPPTTITLLTPAPGAINVNPLPVLSWTDSNRPVPVAMPPGFKSPYWVRIATDSTFQDVMIPYPGLPNILTAPYVHNAVANDTADTIKVSLVKGQKYYWRVMVPEGFYNGDGSYASGSFTVVPDAPDVPALSTPADAAVDISLVAQLSWSAAARAVLYRAQISTVADFSDPQSILELTTANLSATANLASPSTTYYWRVRAENGGGNSAYSNPRSFKTVPPPPAAPLLMSPADNAVDVAVDVLLKWSPGSAGVTHHVQVATDASFNSLVVNDSGLSTSEDGMAALTKGSVYYWRARRKNAGGAGAWSTPFQFTVVIPVPDAPAHVSPTAGAIDQPTALAFRWRKVDWAETYTLEVSSDLSFATPMVSQPNLLDTVSGASGFSVGTTLYWRVAAANHIGQSAWSTPTAFTTVPMIPIAPDLLAPSHASYVSPTPAFLWSKADRAVTYQLQVATDINFADLKFNQAGMTDTAYSGLSLDRNTNYYWRVRGTNPGGDGLWSFPNAMTVYPNPPGAPTLVAPADHAADLMPGGLILSFTVPAGSQVYDVQVASDSGFNTLVFNDSLGAILSLHPGTLARGGTFWWRARARNLGGPGAWSSARIFSTLPEVPAVPHPLSPDSNAVNLAVSGTLHWNSVPGATRYAYALLYESVNGDSKMLVPIDTGSTTDTTHAFGPLSNAQKYAWVVAAANVAGQSAWSDFRFFTTIPELPAGVTLVFPNDGDTVSGDSLTARWHGITGADSYRVEVSTDADFASPVPDSGLTDSLKVIHYAAANGKYWWRVQAHNAAGWGPFGGARWFQVSLPGVATLDLRLGAAFQGGAATLRYALPDASRVTIRLFDTQGRLRALPMDAMQAAGRHSFELPTQGLSQGLYLLRFEARPAGRPGFRKDAPVFLGR
jgi:hypothetical protein